MLPPQHPIASLGDLAALNECSNGQFQVTPYFAIFQPKNTRAVYYKDDFGHTTRIEFFANGREMICRIEALTNIRSSSVHAIDIVGYSQGQAINDVTSLFDVRRDPYTGEVARYAIRTKKCRVYVDIDRTGGSSDVGVTLLPSRRKFTLRDVKAWDGASIPIVSGPEATGV
ncbi:hypothetical protein THASP1DRAFT_32770 [Thamnocephalis sphaerospora]|uniref:Uncharacterized protein n=1 Tax=Thamnocephalis sphaerospora TaxID=78915 RepID=A0A4P9XI83_9FUNG|nr:hypothetical protein THASP1DRAFT_32770 [Thamnocephalis sphaerospora]|eukprot:RKP05388.1 hypothetical protein THASP1DRAFT_32770 [Thamnocephalis sphaerospora]